jgi:hypothetical protein
MPVIASSSLARAAPVAASARASQTRPPRAPPRVAAASRSSRVVVGFLRSPRRGPILPPLAHRAVVQEDCDADCVAETWEELEAEVANEVVGNVMTPRANVSCARASDNVLDALEVLVSNRHSGVPVLDDDERVVGVISEYDLMVRIGREGKKQSEKDDGMFPKIGRCDEFGGASSPPVPALEKPQPDISFTRRFRLSTKSFTGTEPLEARSTDD